MTRIQLELNHDLTGGNDSLHVVGSLSVAGGPPTTFVGWVALLALLEESIASELTSTVPDEPATTYQNKEQQ